MIAKAGKPLVKVMALDAPEAGQQRRLGFLAGYLAAPEDFDQIGAQEIERLFGDESLLLTTDERVAEYPGSIKKV